MVKECMVQAAPPRSLAGVELSLTTCCHTSCNALLHSQTSASCDLGAAISRSIAQAYCLLTHYYHSLIYQSPNCRHIGVTCSNNWLAFPPQIAVG